MAKGLKPVGECIYCGAKDGPLTDEHIVPAALSGNAVLPEASCADCGEVTSRFELTVTREQLLQVRAQLGLRSRRKSLPKEMPLTIERAEKPETVLLGRTEHPTMVLFLLYPLPGILTGTWPEKGVTIIGHQLHQVGGPPLEEVMKKLGSKTVTSTHSFKGNEFERLLAKIAYGFAVAQVGIDKVRDSPLRSTILGTIDDAGKWIGSGLYEAPRDDEGALHQVILEGHPGGWLIARIRLFATKSVPEYVVVVISGDPAKVPKVEHGGAPFKPKPGVTSTYETKITPRHGHEPTEPPA